MHGLFHLPASESLALTAGPGWLVHIEVQAAEGRGARCFVKPWMENARNNIYMGCDLSSVTHHRLFFANKQFSVANLPRTPCLSTAKPMLIYITPRKTVHSSPAIWPKSHQLIMDNSSKPCELAATITETFLRTGGS